MFTGDDLAPEQKYLVNRQLIFPFQTSRLELTCPSSLGKRQQKEPLKWDTDLETLASFR